MVDELDKLLAEVGTDGLNIEVARQLYGRGEILPEFDDLQDIYAELSRSGRVKLLAQARYLQQIERAEAERESTLRKAEASLLTTDTMLADTDRATLSAEQAIEHTRERIAVARIKERNAKVELEQLEALIATHDHRLVELAKMQDALADTDADIERMILDHDRRRDSEGLAKARTELEKIAAQRSAAEIENSRLQQTLTQMGQRAASLTRHREAARNRVKRELAKLQEIREAVRTIGLAEIRDPNPELEPLDEEPSNSFDHKDDRFDD